MEYGFYGYDNSDVNGKGEFSKIRNGRMMYDILSEIWCAETCAPRMREGWNESNKTLGQCSITAFLAQDVFGGKVYGILRNGGNYHCYNVIGDSVFDLTSEQFGDEKLCYENNPEQFREIHFQKEEKRLRYEYLKAEFIKKLAVMEQYKVLQIAEDDFGCEGIPEDSEPMLSILTENESGSKKWIKLPEKYVDDNGIEEGDFITI